MEIFGKAKEDLYENNENNSNGMYPLGKGGLWHSGIHLHFEEPITVPLQGDIVAYKIADKYEQNSKGKNVSKSFVLMKHNVNITRGLENSQPSKIEFFSLYIGLRPDSELKVTQEFSQPKELTDQNKKIDIPFYKDVKFFVNLEKCDCYKKLNKEVIGNFYEGSKGCLCDNAYLENKTFGNYVNIKLGSNEIKLPPKAFDLVDTSKFYKVSVTGVGINYYPTNTDDNVFYPRGTITKDSVFYCDSEPVRVGSQNYYKIKSNGKILKKQERSGYIFQNETFKKKPDSDYAYVQEDLKYSVLYNVKEIADSKDFFFACKYEDLIKFVNDANKINMAKAFVVNLGFGINKAQLSRDITEKLQTDGNKKTYNKNDLIFICNEKYEWNQNVLSKDRKKQNFYDISFKGELSSYAILYVSNNTFQNIVTNVKEVIDRSRKLVSISAIKELNNKLSCTIINENVEIDAQNNISLITNNLLYKVKTRLPASCDTEWLVRSSDLNLLAGPEITLKDDGSNFTSPSKGLMLYNKDNPNNPELLLDKASDFFSVFDLNYFIENIAVGYQRITYKNNDYYVKISEIGQLKVNVINKSDFKTDTIIRSDENKSLYLLKDKVLGFAADDAGKKSFDFVTFTKDSSFLEMRDKLIIRTPKENSEIYCVEKVSKKINQKLPYNSVLKIIGKEELLGRYYYKIKYSLIPIWFNPNKLSGLGRTQTVKSDLNAVWISEYKINSDGSSSGSNVWASNNDLSILIDLIINNFDTFKGKSYEFMQKNKNGDSTCLKVNFEGISDEYYIDDISNFTLDEKKRTLTIIDRKKAFGLYEEIPFAVSRTKDVELSEFTCNEGDLLKYKDTEYYALVRKDSSEKPSKDYYIKKDDTEEKNFLDWKEFFRVYDKDDDDDVFYNLPDFLDSCGLEAETLKNLKKELSGIRGKDAHQEKIRRIYSNPKLKKCLHNIIVKHPLEFSDSLYKEDELYKKTHNPDCKNFVADMKKVSFWDDISGVQGIDNVKSLYFSHPVTFFGHIDLIKENPVPYLYEKWGARITGKNGNVFILDGGKGKLLSNVEWYSQRDNVGDKAKGVYGYNMCQLTSLAMVMNAMGIKRKRSDCQFEDELYDIANLAGYGGSKLWTKTIDVYKVVLSNYNRRYEMINSSSNIIETIKDKIDNGIPVIKSMNYKSDHTGGHVTVVVGYIGNSFIVNDPYGNRNTGNISGTTYCTDENGAFVEYPCNKWDYDIKWGCTLKE